MKLALVFFLFFLTIASVCRKVLKTYTYVIRLIHIIDRTRGSCFQLFYGVAKKNVHC